MPSDKESTPEPPSPVNSPKSPVKVRKNGSVHHRHHNNVDATSVNSGGKKSVSPRHHRHDRKKSTSTSGTHRSHRPHRSKTSEGNLDSKKAATNGKADKDKEKEKAKKADKKEKTEVSIEEKKPEEKGCFGGLGILYNFADGVDIQLMIIGTLLALVQSALPPFVWLVMGDFVSFAIEREAVKQNKTNELDALARRGKVFSTVQEFENSTAGVAFAQKQIEVDAKFEGTATPVFVAMLSLSIATFLAAFFQRLAFEWSGIRQVFRVKKAYIKKLLNMDVAWLESRHSGQVASMLHDLLC
uniref:ABC transmembrane type-1 domain-containing protein n=1 Tax=Panagrellus redivivus TaxID=6233 RepID=A0A7E4UUY2_PANRE